VIGVDLTNVFQGDVNVDGGDENGGDENGGDGGDGVIVDPGFGTDEGEDNGDGGIDLGGIDLGGIDLGGIDLGGIDLGWLDQLFNGASIPPEADDGAEAVTE